MNDSTAPTTSTTPTTPIKTYVTFGQAHRHTLPDGRVIDEDCIALVHGDRDEVHRLFGTRFCTTYPESHITPKFLSHFPCGIMKV